MTDCSNGRVDPGRPLPIPELIAELRRIKPQSQVLRYFPLEDLSRRNGRPERARENVGGPTAVRAWLRFLWA